MQHPPKKQPVRQRKWLGRILVLAALVLAAAFVALLPQIRRLFPAQQPALEEKELTFRTLDVRDTAQLESVTVYPDGVNCYRLCMQDGTLMLESNGTLQPVDEMYQSSLLTLVTEIAVENTVTEDPAEAEEHLEAMGLIEPMCKAIARYQDGSEETFEVGSMVHDSPDYYFRWSGAPGVYTCHSGVVETLTTTANLLIPFEQPELAGSLLQKLHLSNAHGDCTLEFADGSYGRLIAPYQYPINATDAQTMIAAAQNVRLGAYEAPLTQENSAFYGFDDPLCTIVLEQAAGMVTGVDETGGLKLIQAPALEQQFVIGRAEGEFFYTCAYEGNVYLISRFLVETLVETDWRSLLTRTPALVEDSLLTFIVFETPGQTTEIRIERTESVLENNQLETDANGNIVYLTEIAVNGQPAPTELLDEVTNRLAAFAMEGSIGENAVVDKEPRWRITLVTDTGDTRVLEGHRLDVFSDAVKVDGVMQHYVYNGAINALTEGLV